MEMIIEVENLVKTYPGVVPTQALRGVSFKIEKGEFVALTGKSGAGKSTLIHQLGLIDTPTSGKVLIEGEDVLALSDKQKTRYRLEKFGHVFQEYALIAELTALENVFLPEMAIGGEREHYVKHANELLNMVGLGDRIEHYPSELSGGEEQRVAIARSLINDPKILFADEPTANLDTISSKMILDIFLKLNREGQTIVMITHEDEYAKLAHRNIVLSDGLIVSNKIRRG